MSEGGFKVLISLTVTVLHRALDLKTFTLFIFKDSSISFVPLLLRANHRRAHGLELVYSWFSVKDEQKK